MFPRRGHTASSSQSDGASQCHGGARPKVKCRRDGGAAVSCSSLVAGMANGNGRLKREHVDAKTSVGQFKGKCYNKSCPAPSEGGGAMSCWTEEEEVTPVPEVTTCHGQGQVSGHSSAGHGQPGHFSYPLLQWAFSGYHDNLPGALYHSVSDPVAAAMATSSCRKACPHRECSRRKGHRSKHCPQANGGSGGMSQSLFFVKPSSAEVKSVGEGQVNHISLFDQSDELLALERWRNAGLALRRVLTSKHGGKSSDSLGRSSGGGGSGDGDDNWNKLSASRERLQVISPECQTVVDEIFDDVDDDTLKVEESPTSSTGDLSVGSDQPPRQSSCPAVKYPAVLSSPSAGHTGIWDSQLYPTAISGQFDLSPEPYQATPKPEKPSGGQRLFPWRQQASLLGACLFPQCIGARKHTSEHRGELGVQGGELGVCNDREECNTNSLKQSCDNQDNEWESAIGIARTGKVKEDSCFDLDCDSKVKDVDEDDSGGVQSAGDLEMRIPPVDGGVESGGPSLSCSRGTSSFHSEDGCTEFQKSNGRLRDHGGDSDDATDYSSMCDCSGDIYFYEDTDRNDAVPRGHDREGRAGSPCRKTLQRERKKKLVHARKTHRRKSSSSSSEVLEEKIAHDYTAPDLSDAFHSAYEPCPTFLTCYGQEEITPPRRSSSSSVARHFLDRNTERSYDHHPVFHNGFLRSRDVNSDVSPLPNFELSPLNRIPSFLESTHNCRLPATQDGVNGESSDFWNLDQHMKPGSAETDRTEAQLDRLPVDASDPSRGRNSHLDATGLPWTTPPEFSGQSDVDDNADWPGAPGDQTSVLPCDRAGNSLLSPDSWIRLIDEIYQPIICESDAGEESAISGAETEKATDTVPDFFRCQATDRSSDSGDADDEFECECEHCQLLRSLDRPSQFVSSVAASRDLRDGGREDGSRSHAALRTDPWETDWLPHGDEDFEISLDDLRPLEPFLLSLQDLPQDPVDLMFQNVITQMLAVHPELLGDQAPPPIPQNVMDNLPSMSVTNDHKADDLTCPVCLCHFELGEEMTRLPCRHLYHPLCIQAWLSKSGTCPVCRHSLHGLRNEGHNPPRGHGHDLSRSPGQDSAASRDQPRGHGQDPSRVQDAQRGQSSSRGQEAPEEPGCISCHDSE